jgi:tetratricopeptide (TPR) repeat protein
MSRCALLVVMLVAARAVAAPAQPEEIPLPALEVSSPLTATLPALPAFELPPSEPGFVDPRRLRVDGKNLLDTKVKAKGYIIWVYNCVEAVRAPKETAARTQKRIDEDPTICERPKFYLGDSKKTPFERAVWVVDVPRPPNKLEKELLPKDELRSWPKVPTYKVGDYVVVTGDFKIRSPHNEANSDGLIVFEAIESAKPPKKVATPVPTPFTPTTRAAPTVKPAKLALIEPKQRGISMTALRNANLAHGQRQFAQAAKHYQEAVKAWPQNHLAWYGLGGALAAQGMWEAGADAFAKAVDVHPESAMYQQWSGVAAYESALQLARIDQAKRAGVPPEEITVDKTAINFDKARDALDTALALEPTLWRAHYYLGRVHREARRVRLAAEEFTEAAKARPAEQGPWVALTELYRKWDYTADAIAVATIGLENVRQDASDVAFVLGMAHDDNNDLKAAIAAFTKALELKPDHSKAQFQRGQTYFKLGKWSEAQTDLDAFVKAASPSLEFAKQQANKMLTEIAAKPKKK